MYSYYYSLIILWVTLPSFFPETIILVLNQTISFTLITAGHVKPHFDNRCKVFELDPCDGHGKVCLVYKDVKAGRWNSDNMLSG